MSDGETASWVISGLSLLVLGIGAGVLAESFGVALLSVSLLELSFAYALYRRVQR